MLKITIHPEAKSTRLELEGRLAGPWVRELENSWQTVAAAPHDKIVVDLSEVTFVDTDGKMLLTRMWQQGTQLRAVGCLTRGIIEEIENVGRSGSCHSNRKSKTERN